MDIWKLNSSSGVTFEETFPKAKLWAQCSGDCVDAVVEALVGKLSVRISVSMVGSQQGVQDGSNSLLFAAFLFSPSHANDGEEEEDSC